LPSSKLGISSSNRHHHLLNSILPKRLPVSLFFCNNPEKPILQNENVQDQSHPKAELQTIQLPQGTTQQLANLETKPGRKTDNNNNNNKNKNSRKTFNQFWHIEKNATKQKETRTEQRKKKKEEEDKKTLLKSIN
jgi:hypothetical protein